MQPVTQAHFLLVQVLCIGVCRHLDPLLVEAQLVVRSQLLLALGHNQAVMHHGLDHNCESLQLDQRLFKTLLLFLSFVLLLVTFLSFLLLFVFIDYLLCFFLNYALLVLRHSYEE